MHKNLAERAGAPVEANKVLLFCLSLQNCERIVGVQGAVVVAHQRVENRRIRPGDDQRIEARITKHRIDLMITDFKFDVDRSGGAGRRRGTRHEVARAVSRIAVRVDGGIITAEVPQ